MHDVTITACDGVNELGSVCDQELGHEGYHWAGKLAWVNPGSLPPLCRGLVQVTPQTPEVAISVRHSAAFCPHTHPELGECQLRWKHPGPHAAPGVFWADPPSVSVRLEPVKPPAPTGAGEALAAFRGLGKPPEKPGG